MARQGIEPRTSDLRVRCPTDCATRPSVCDRNRSDMMSTSNTSELKNYQFIRAFQSDRFTPDLPMFVNTKTIAFITLSYNGVPRGSKAPIRVDPYFKNGVPRGSKAPIRVDPYFKNTGRPVSVLLTLLVYHIILRRLLFGLAQR